MELNLDFTLKLFLYEENNFTVDTLAERRWEKKKKKWYKRDQSVDETIVKNKSKEGELYK